MSDADRIERLESIVRGLYREVAELRDELGRLGGTTASSRRVDLAAMSVATSDTDVPSGAPMPSAEPAPPPPSAPLRRHAREIDLEALVGRYATIALATVVILVGAGSFLTWAIAHGWLGPAARVILGALAAVAVAAVGGWLRTRGAMRFSSTLLALALAILHVDAWAAGPRLHVVAPWAALIVAAIASAVLAALAHRAHDQVLFCVGLGGALLAPFVVSEGAGNAAHLAIYGWIVIAGGLLALRTRGWQLAPLLLAIGCAVYAATTIAIAGAPPEWALRHVPVLFALACAVTALVAGSRDTAASLALAFLAVAAGALFVVDAGNGRERGATIAGIAGTMIAFAAVVRAPRSPGMGLAGVGALPLAFLAVALAASHLPIVPAAAWIPSAWVVLGIAFALAYEPDRDGWLTVAGTAAGVALVVALRSSPVWCIAALAGLGALLSVLMRWRRSSLLAIPAFVHLGVATLWAWSRLAERPAFAYRPLLTRASAAALIVVAAWIVFVRQARRADEPTRSGVEDALAGLLPWMPALAAFVFVRQELAGAISADVAAFLLIVYYAAAGVVTIAAGRRANSAGARGIGLALALYAGIKALIHAWSLSAIGLRVGTCALVGLFIAVVAYWYRAPDTRAT